MLNKAGWLDSYSYKNTIGILKEIALVHASQAGPKHGPPLSKFIREEDWISLLNYSLTYEYEDSYFHLKHARQALGFFQKLEPLKVNDGESKTYKAFKRFAESEVSCKKVNDRFCQYRLGVPMGYPYDVILTDAKRKIERVLGKAPSLSTMQFKYGPGATITTKKKDASARIKLGAPLGCSHELFRYAHIFMSELPDLALHHGEVVNTWTDSVGDTYYDVEVTFQIEFGRLEFVPKDALKFRTIIVEPSVNTLFQQGLGKEVRKCLKKAGVDLDNGWERNKHLAYVSSIINRDATIDFRTASDTSATQMVAFLTPDDWYVLFALARTGVVTYEGLPIRLEKFSTMGNSFTFELESLIFWALAWSTCKFLKLEVQNLAIFGDDLVIPKEAVPLAELVFAFCGFSFNMEKSFVDGPFRESCGSDFYMGINIRPYYQKNLITGETLFTLHNYYVRSNQLEMAKLVKKWIHPDLRIYGPDGYGDGHLIGDWVGLDKRITMRGRDSKGKLKKFRSWTRDLGWDGVFFESYRHVKNLNKIPHHGDKLLPTYSIYVRGPHENEEPLTQGSSQERLWADPKYFVTPGSRGYEKVLIYTLARPTITIE